MTTRRIARVGRWRLVAAGVVIGALLVLGGWLMQPVTGPVGIAVTPGPWRETCRAPYYTVRNGEWLPVGLDRVTFTYGAGARFPLPARTLPPGASVRVWSGKGADDAGNIYLGRAEAEWHVNGFVALLDGKKPIVSSIMTCDPAFRL